MTTFTDGAPPSVTPEPDDGSVPHHAGAPAVGTDQEADPDPGSSWLRDEIQRRIAEGSAGSGGRHARRGEATSSSSTYVPRHSVATPGPGAPRPAPVGGQMSQASELLRRERTEAAGPVWSGPPIGSVGDPPGTPQPPAAAGPPAHPMPPSPSGPPPRPGYVRPGIAAAAAMRGAARGRARAAAAAAAAAPAVASPPGAPTPADAPPVVGASHIPASAPPVDPAPLIAPGPGDDTPSAPPRPDDAPPPDSSSTTPVEAAAPAPPSEVPPDAPAGPDGPTYGPASVPPAPAPPTSDGPPTGPISEIAPSEALPERSAPTGPMPPAGDVPTGTSPPGIVPPGIDPSGTVPSGTVPSGTVPSPAPAGTAPTQDPTAPSGVPAAPPTQPRPTSADPASAEPTGPVPPVAPEGRTAAPQSAAPDHMSDRAGQTDAPPGQISVPEQRGAELRGAGLPRPDAAEDLASKRVRVVLAERKGVARPVRTVVDIQEGTGVGELLRTNLIGSQLAVALRFAIGAGLTLGLLPLLFAMFPEIGRVEVLGIRLPWLLLGVLVYPFLFGLGLWHTRTAEHVEQNFADHVQD